MNKTISTLLIIGIHILIGEVSFAGSATWNLDPVDNNWNNPANWTPETVPNGPTDVATFAASSITSLKFSARITKVAEIVFTPDASSFNITADAELAHSTVKLIIGGRGITNNSGVTQSFTAGPTMVFVGVINFRNSATAGDGTALNALGSATNGAFSGSEINFYNTSTAGTASIVAEGALGRDDAGGGNVFFRDKATAANASFTITGAMASGSSGGRVLFFDSSTAPDASFTIKGPTNGGSFGGQVSFSDNSYAGAAQFMVFSGGGIDFSDASDGGQSRIELFGGTFTANSTDRGEVSVGSIEGEDGVIGLGTLNFIVGSNNLSTAFSGTIVGGGPMEKIGNGTLTLTGANSYIYGTTVSSGVLKVNNVTGSGTGLGTVFAVNAGTLGGSGIITGAVIVGTNTGVQAFLAPSKGVQKPATLTIQSPLTLNDDSTYIYKLDTRRPASDEVIANGVTIDSGAKFSFRPSGNNALTTGQVFTVINNTAAAPIAGTFHNLRDGQIIRVNGSNLQASYTGGDGNDLILTVVP